ncbi:MAG: hypothetical protein ACXABK_00670 [Candidatus Heimdallarchaeaceae archaeon]|jgi:hypothetical protein
MSKSKGRWTKKRWESKEVEHIEFEEDSEEKKSEAITVNWSRIVFLGFITSLVFLLIDSIIGIILFYVVDRDFALILYMMQYFLLGEAAMVVFLGACLGNFGQSVLVSNLKERLFGADPLSIDSFREATFNAFTYYSGGALLFLYTAIVWRIFVLISTTI